MSRRAGLYPGLKGFSWAYDGQHTTRNITQNGNAYQEITLLTGGVFAFSGKAVLDLCLVGGGGRSEPYYANIYNGGTGGGGGYMQHYTGISTDELATNAIVVVIGAGGISSTSIPASATQFGVYSANGGDLGSGGSGGGQGSGASSGALSGDGLPKTPYSDTDNFSGMYHGAGGGGGNTCGAMSQTQLRGGAGGTNGGNGGAYVSATPTIAASGGVLGGGDGGLCLTTSSGPQPGSDATYYGGGAGGGAGIYMIVGNHRTTGGNGYQGVCYVRIRKGAAA